MDIKLIVGLGNPGSQYDGTRHNIGFVLADRIANTSRWSDSQFGAQVAEVVFGGRSVKLVKPQSFMNLSGGPVSGLAGYFKVRPEEILVAHDEVDLPLGTIRVKQGGGDGGHNGLKSIAASLGSPNFIRLRLGVGRPTHPSIDLADWVLGRFGKDERAVLDDLLANGETAALHLMSKSLIEVQNEFN